MKEYTNRLAAVLADLKASNADDHQLPLFPDHTEAEPKAEPKAAAVCRAHALSTALRTEAW